MTKEEMELAKQFYTKVSELRAEVLTKDWADDKRLQIGGYGGYGYLSNDKIVKQIAPLYPKHGLEIEKRFFDLQERKACGSLEQHWTCQVEVTLVDIQTGYHGTPSVAYGEAADVGDKGINKCQTCADKNWHIKFFNLADGIDADAETVESVNARKFMKTEAEKEELQSKAIEAAKASEQKKAEPKFVVAKVPGGLVPNASANGAILKTPVKKEEPKKEEPKKEAPVSAEQSVADAPAFEPRGPQKNAIKGILATWETLAKNSKVTPAEYNAMVADNAKISSDAEAVAFIRKYRRSM